MAIAVQNLAIVYFPKTNLEKIDNFRENYDPHWQIIPPHITIVSPVAGIFENQLIEHIEDVVKNINPFSIHLTGLTKTLDNCLFLLVKEGNAAIVNLHDKLYSGILTSYIPTDFSFVPHITLGEFTATDNKLFAKACSEAQKLNFDITCNFDAVSVIKGDGVSPAKIIKTFNLHS